MRLNENELYTLRVSFRKKPSIKQRIARSWKRARRRGVAAALVPLHVTAHAERLAAPAMRALERLLARVAVAMYSQAARPRECFVARLADVAVLGLREGGLRGRRDVVVVLPWVYRCWRGDA